LLGTIGTQLFTLGTTVIIARFLGKEGFGELGMIQSTIGLMGSFAGFGLGQTTTKYVSEFKEKDPARTGRIIGLTYLVALIAGGIMTLVCVLAAPWLAIETLNAPHLTFFLQIGAIVLLISAFNGVQSGTLSGFQAFKAGAKINLFQGLLTLPITFVLIYFLGLMGAVLSLLVSALSGMIMSGWVLSGQYAVASIKVDFRRSWSERKILWNFSIPATMSGTMVVPVIWAANAVLVNQPNGYAELGLFNAANKFCMIIMFLPNVIGMVAVPMLSEIYGKDSSEYFARAINLNLRAVWSSALPLGFLAIGLSSWLMDLYGPKFHEGRLILAIMVSVAILNLANGTVGQALIGSGKIWAGVFMNLGWAVILLLSVFFFAPKWGGIGMALAYVLAYSFHTLWQLLYSAIKFGPDSVQHCFILTLITALAFLLALFIGQLSNIFIISLSLFCCLSSAIVGWRLFPSIYRKKILATIW
jgi:O-antigen/teichoic acid export membrane protein